MATEMAPKLRLVSERDADPATLTLYEEIKDALGIPWTPAVFQAYAVYPAFFQLAWDELRPNVVTEAFHHDARKLRESAASAMAHLDRSEYGRQDVEGWGGDVPRIQETLDTFNYGNPKLLICALAVTRSLEGATSRVPGGQAKPAQPTPEEAAVRARQVEMVDPIQPPPVGPIFEDIKRTLGVPLVNSDYRALAKWPVYFQQAWESLKPVVATPEYKKACDHLTRQADEALGRFARPIDLSPAALERVGLPEADQENVLGVARLFSDLLPCLILNVEALKRPLSR